MANRGMRVSLKLWGHEGVLKEKSRGLRNGQGVGQACQAGPRNVHSEDKWSNSRLRRMELGGDREQWGRGGGERGQDHGGEPAAPPMASDSLCGGTEAGTQWKLCFMFPQFLYGLNFKCVDSKWSCNLKTLQMPLVSGLFSLSEVGFRQGVVRKKVQ